MEIKNKWYEIREMLAEKIFKTYSDAGALKIGNKDFSILIPNGYGDGETRVAIIKLEEKKYYDLEAFRFFTSVEGTFDIYDYDCDSSGDIIQTIEGRYGIYVYEGFVVFEQWEQD